MNKPIQIIQENQLTEEEFLNGYRKYLLNLQDNLLKEDQIDLPLVHDFTPGIYVRTIFMPKGTFVIGKTHKTEHFNIVHSGRANVMIDGEYKEISAPDMFVSKEGVKKVLWILEDMVWSTIHATTETNLDILEKELILTFEEERLLINLEVGELL
jgi:quercetin dioxygenase-like cupin family protein